MEPLGEMLLQTWEGYATQIANVPEDELPSLINSVIAAEAIDTSVEANVVIARDTRLVFLYSLRDQQMISLYLPARAPHTCTENRDRLLSRLLPMVFKPWGSR